jgi:hypothetical protein
MVIYEVRLTAEGLPRRNTIFKASDRTERRKTEAAHDKL